MDADPWSLTTILTAVAALAAVVGAVLAGFSVRQNHLASRASMSPNWEHDPQKLHPIGNAEPDLDTWFGIFVNVGPRAAGNPTVRLEGDRSDEVKAEWKLGMDMGGRSVLPAGRMSVQLWWPSSLTLHHVLVLESTAMTGKRVSERFTLTQRSRVLVIEKQGIS